MPPSINSFGSKKLFIPKLSTNTPKVIKEKLVKMLKRLFLLN
ncbi:hypothetical protein DESAMIL20_1228 [Desulfurella amilsii]|uniref:Uncharacterized protein n=1 Tax=Desulfurella amilsii TaxID=1562698 RepID=A0A1X4XVY1_9BACT|nr:hypothetical protein DESAMIL20_1228 [Desulfurella amilsii]